MRFELFFFDTVDSSLGRVDHGSFSHQTLMEMVIEGITNTERICGEGDEPIDIHEWGGVTVEGGEVVEIEWIKYYLKGSVHLGWLPSSVTKCVLVMNHLTGTLDLASLPTSMETLDLDYNAFTGSICLETLPAGMEHLDVSNNQLSADPTKGHLSVVGWTSTPVLGEAKNLFKPLVVFLSWRRPY
ncbi:hypothetical protein XU18_2344 [Perkinsela sp. CCAP 1560/4]|nr:hypothetical protein XU18_2344 [Perkinsela sp. CCAP 1560/4]|eukprot:KNH06871.1 hypothetical protein XU18_2344 [Perkinsela sp. CCAP 1560/4]